MQQFGGLALGHEGVRNAQGEHLAGRALARKLCRHGLAHTAGRSIQMADFTVEDQPQLLWHESTVGCPENGVFAPDGRFLVPCGYQGLLVEKRDGDDAPAPVVPAVAEAHGYDWTNRVFTVTGLAPGAGVTLDVWAAGIQESLVADASGAVGIYDLNYFSRLCKQFTGYTPSHFRRKWN